MAFKRLMLLPLLLLIGYQSSAQIEFSILRMKKTNSNIKVELEIENRSTADFIVKNYRNKMNVVDYLSLEIADSLNYEGMSFLVKSDNSYLDIANFPFEFKHKTKLGNWLDLIWLKVRNAFTRNELVVPANSKINRHITIDIDGLEMLDGEKYLQVVYHKADTKNYIVSNAVLIDLVHMRN